jgi:hypothetical protein
MTHSTSRLRKRLAIAFLSLLAVASAVATAIAAEPSSGKIDKAVPKVEWTGTTVGSFLVLNPMANAPAEVPCEAPTCDTFALEVADGPAEIEFANEVEDEDGAIGGIRVEMPDGSVQYADGDSKTGAPFKLKIKNAPNGSYSVGMINNYIDGAQPYKGSAGFVIKPPVATTPAPAPGTPPAPGGGTGSGTATTAEGITITVKVPKSSAKKLGKKKKLVATVTVSREVASIAGTLKKGAKTIGKGSLGKVTKTAKLSIKVPKKIKAGKYSLTVVAKDGKGVTASKTLSLTIKK